MEVQAAPPGEMAIITRDANSFRRNVLPILYKLIGNDPLYKAGLSVVELWGRKIHLIGCHDSRAEGKIRGCTLQAALVDEAAIIPESSWMILIQRVAMNNGRIFATTNPDSSMHWLKTDFIDNNPDVTTFYFDLNDNPVLKEEERDFLRRQHTGVYYRRFIAGEWCMAEGAIFEFFDERIHCVRKPPAYAKFHIIGVDIGFTNPTAFVLLGYNDDALTPLWVEDEYYWDSKKTGRQKTTAEFAQDLKDFCWGHNVRGIYIDPAAASFKVEMRRSGLTGIPIKDADNDVAEGIKTLSSYLQMGDLKVVSKCKNMIGEIQGYCWDNKAAERGIDQPIKRADHLCVTGDTLILTDKGEMRIKELSNGQLYNFNQELKSIEEDDFINASLTRENAEIYELELEDGKILHATADHKVLTNSGWKELQELTLCDIIYTCNTKSILTKNSI